jgi:hypothetical protein
MQLLHILIKLALKYTLLLTRDIESLCVLATACEASLIDNVC